MGRRVEDAMIHVATGYAQQMGAKRLVAKYLPTDRNNPTLMVLRQSGLKDLGDDEFEWDCSTNYSAPEGVELVGVDVGLSNSEN